MDSPKSSPKLNPRLQHFLALCGLGSRRSCERLIASGRVSVDGVVVARQGVCVNPAAQRIEVDGRPVSAEPKIHLMINKSPGTLCTASDPQGRRTFKDLLPATLAQRVYTVGRLDRASEGLLLVTNDGQLAQALMHPRHQVEKTYLVWTQRPLAPTEEQRLRQGILAQGERLMLDDLAKSNQAYRVRLHAGRNRHIRRMFAALDLKITRLQRIALGPLKLGQLAGGGWRYLTQAEIKALWHYIQARQASPNNQGIKGARKASGGAKGA